MEEKKRRIKEPKNEKKMILKCMGKVKKRKSQNDEKS